MWIDLSKLIAAVVVAIVIVVCYCVPCDINMASVSLYLDWVDIRDIICHRCTYRFQ